ncbi:kelch-like protein 23 [Lepeophtheirus salmonis]|uniref:kelch-like protein 23 n=1 Tax=Lepeophtheirus salmonis TaxID=72036 RepID=UPI001AE9AC2F|nr:kelch-like protein 18 [Lepeophtheirus salmonis]
MYIEQIRLLQLISLLTFTTALQKCFPSPSTKCSLKGANLIGVYHEIHNEYFCAERCLDFHDCKWWTYHDARSYENDGKGYANSCELFRSVCSPVFSTYSRTDKRCGIKNTSYVTLVIGGDDRNGNPVGEVEVFDFLGCCEKANFMKNPIRKDIIKKKHASSFINYLNTIISCGGMSAEQPFSASCLIYDFNKLHWYNDTRVIPDMTEARSYFTMEYAYGEIYAMGGYNGEEIIKSVEIYNPITREWRQGPSLSKRLSNHCALKVKDSIYVMGGQSRLNSSETERFVARYNVTSGTWSPFTPMNLPRMNHGCAYDATRGVIIVSGGQIYSNDPQSYEYQISELNLREGIWRDEKDRRNSIEKRIAQSITVYHGIPVVLNGIGKSNRLESIEMQKNGNILGMQRVKLLHDRKYFSWINVPQEMIVTGCHA